MNVFICIDEDGGMLFNKRRQSQDSKVREKMSEIVGESPIFMNAYSAKQFSENDNIVVDENFLVKAGEEEFCFIENVEIPKNGINKIYIFNWNRKYPSDVKFEYSFAGCGLLKISTEEFPGSSHEKITLDIYGRD